ncbi:uncharacterized protein LOC103572731 [Microplitis demolitor]|uniref:uncharacterized protein LOC103572731 n=1 Tax=Microplitis demolitor TaxID=69319 RepID=UPI0004CD9754|nr:uncharacterized protein LOC103572731 [Microplitis demolitor]
MACVKLNVCCCCFSLKLGVLILGIFGIIGSIYMTAIPFSGNDQLCIKFYYNKCGDLNGGERAGITLYNLIGMFVTILMIYGSEKNIHTLMLPIIVMYLIGLIWSAVIFLLISIESFREVDATFGTIMLILGGLTTALLFYFWMVIYCRYKEVKVDQIPFNPMENRPLHP